MAKYPWEIWCDGLEHTVSRGEHFTATTDSFRSHLYNHAAWIKKKVRLREAVKDTIVFQFYDKPDK